MLWYRILDPSIAYSAARTPQVLAMANIIPTMSSCCQESSQETVPLQILSGFKVPSAKLRVKQAEYVESVPVIPPAKTLWQPTAN